MRKLDTQSHFQKEIYEAYERRPDAARFPASDIGEIVNDLAIDIKLNFQQVVKKSLEQSPNISSIDKRLIADRLYDMPSVEIYDDYNQIRQHFYNLGYDFQAGEIYPDEILMVIQLPEPMRNKENLFGKNFKPNEINWFEIYNQCLAELWNTAYRFISDKNLAIDRINPAGIHRPDGYYYLWMISPTNRPAIESRPPDDEPIPKKDKLIDD